MKYTCNFWVKVVPTPFFSMYIYLHLALLSATIRTPVTHQLRTTGLRETIEILKRSQLRFFFFSFLIGGIEKVQTSQRWRKVNRRGNKEKTLEAIIPGRELAAPALSFPFFSFSFFPVILKCFPPPPAKCNNSVQIAYVITFWQTSQSNLTFIFTHLLPLYFTVPALFLFLQISLPVIQSFHFNSSFSCQ